ncbi:MAG: hypothetical protein IJD30_05050 [Clostridia bacterium]|nr:hypothetical protein [Clostridia bacterium]
MSKYVTFQQITKLIYTHLYSSAMLFFLGIFVFAGVVASEIGSVIYSSIATVIYFFSIYNAAVDVCHRDKKSFTQEQPYKFKGLLLPIGLLVVSILLYLLYLVTWKYMTINSLLYSAQGYINNILFMMWTFPFNAFIGLEDGFMNIYGYVIVAVFPFIASFLGYLAAYNNYDITSTISKLIYTTNDKEKNKK